MRDSSNGSVYYTHCYTAWRSPGAAGTSSCKANFLFLQFCRKLYVYLTLTWLARSSNMPLSRNVTRNPRPISPILGLGMRLKPLPQSQTTCHLGMELWQALLSFFTKVLGYEVDVVNSVQFSNHTGMSDRTCLSCVNSILGRHFACNVQYVNGNISVENLTVLITQIWLKFDHYP